MLTVTPNVAYFLAGSPTSHLHWRSWESPSIKPHFHGAEFSLLWPRLNLLPLLLNAPTAQTLGTSTACWWAAYGSHAHQTTVSLSLPGDLSRQIRTLATGLEERYLRLQEHCNAVLRDWKTHPEAYICPVSPRANPVSSVTTVFMITLTHTAVKAARMNQVRRNAGKSVSLLGTS